MAKGPGVSAIIVEEALASGDPRFLEYLRGCDDAQGLARVVERWKRDFRPWAREQVLAYFDLPLDRPGHQVVVKRLFKQAWAKGDEEVIAAALVAVDRTVNRKVRKRSRWVRDGTRYGTYVTVYAQRAQSNVISAKPTEMYDWRTRAKYIDYLKAGPEDRLFSNHTRYYLRRRGWRYFRLMARQRPGAYPAAIAQALRRYTDEDLKDGQAVLDRWALMHACFGQSPSIEFGPSHAKLKEAKPLSELVAPYAEPTWQTAPAARVLLDLVFTGRARVVRMWAVQLLRRHHAGALNDLSADDLLRLLDHADPELQQLGADLLASASAVKSFPVETWLRLLQVKNPTALAVIADAMRQHIDPGRLTLAQAVDIAIARPTPVARLGLAFLEARAGALAGLPAEHDELSRLALAECDAAGRDIAAFALRVLGAPGAYDVGRVSRFFDSLTASVRDGAWGWLVPGSPGWEDPALWARLVETPYEDVRFKLVAALESRADRPLPGVVHRKGLPGLAAPDLAPVWCAVLLGIHRGGRAKLTALRQIADALRASPAAAEALLPVLAVAMRSVRVTEARAGLGAVVGVLTARPELEPLVRAHFPELALEEAAR